MSRNLLSLSDLNTLESIEFLARQVVEGFIIGLHKSPYHGFSVEFAEHRLYNPGDSTKNIDWKVFARTDRLYTKKFEEETNLRCQIVIDTSSSMYYPDEANKPGSINKLRFSVVAAAALIHLMKKQRDATGISLFSEQVERHTRARSSNVHLQLLYSYLDEILNAQPKQKRTSAAHSLHEIAENIPKRSLVVIFSDMMERHLSDESSDQGSELFSALQHLKYNKHEVVLFHVVDAKSEEEFQFENRPYLFEDVETGEKVKLHANQVKEHYLKQMQQFKKQLKLKCDQYKIDFIEADVNKDFAQILVPYLVKRTRLF